MAVLAAALVFGACFGCFAAGWMGGGDAKLATVCVLWLGADQALAYLLLASLLGGGALTLALMLAGTVRRQPEGVPRVRRARMPADRALRRRPRLCRADAAAGLALGGRVLNPPAFRATRPLLE